MLGAAIHSGDAALVELLLRAGARVDPDDLLALNLPGEPRAREAILAVFARHGVELELPG